MPEYGEKKGRKGGKDRVLRKRRRKKEEEGGEGDVRWDIMRSGHEHIIKHVKAAGRRGALGNKEKIEQEQEVRGRMCEGVEDWRTERNKQQSKV